MSLRVLWEAQAQLPGTVRTRQCYVGNSHTLSSLVCNGHGGCRVGGDNVKKRAVLGPTAFLRHRHLPRVNQRLSIITGTKDEGAESTIFPHMTCGYLFTQPLIQGGLGA